MKYRNKHYYRSYGLPLILIPAVALSVTITNYLERPKLPSHPYAGFEPDIADFKSIADRFKAYKSSLADETDGCEKALFTLTGDSVLIYTGPDFENVPNGLRKILYKDHQGSLKTMDVPFSELRFPPDTTDDE